MTTAAIRVLLLVITTGGDFDVADASVEDTPENRELWARTAEDIRNLPPGAEVKIP